MPDWMRNDLDRLRRDGLSRTRRRVLPRGARLAHRGREYVHFAGNDYLALASDPRLAAAAAHAARDEGTGAGASPLVTGRGPALARLERRLARWEGADSALVFPSGFQANLAVLSAVGRGATVFSDALNHASLIDGCRLARADVRVYRHADAGHLENLLRAAPPGRRVVVTDTVFSMDGDTAPLAELVELAERFDALLVLDEAHGTGVLGDTGAGLWEAWPEARRGDPERLLRVGTLSKALGAQGGFVTGTRAAARWLVNVARPYIFSTALAPPVAAAACRAVPIARAAGDRRGHLARLSARLRAGLAARGWRTLASEPLTPIVPILVGGAREAVALSARLRGAGFWVPAIRPPSVPEGASRLRASLCAAHTEADIDGLLDALAQAGAPPYTGNGG